MEKILPVPQQPVEHMNQLELIAFITKVLQTEFQGIQKPINSKRPEWWPDEVPLSNTQTFWNGDCTTPSDQNVWLLKMRSLLHSCYRYYGKEHLLDVETTVKNRRSAAFQVVNNEDGSVSLITNEAVVTFENRQNTEYATHSQKMGQTASVKLSSPLTGFYNADLLDTVRHVDSDQPQQHFFKCPSCDQTYATKTAMLRHHRFYCKLHEAECKSNPYRTRLSNLPVHQKGTDETVVVKPRMRQKLVEEKVILPSKGVYLETLGLIPQVKVKEIQQRSTTKVVNCNMLDFGDENIPPSLPVTPNSKRSLISLFRDASPSANQQQKCKSDCDFPQISSTADESGNMFVSNDDINKQPHQDDYENSYKPHRVVSLLNIDITSFLGSRICKKISAQFNNMDKDSNLRCKNYEWYCRTPVKSRNTGRLRNRRQEFQVTFRKTKHTALKHYHQYKFSRAQLREFCRLLETGLNKQSRDLRRQMPKCKVVLERLSEADLHRWCPQHRLSEKSSWWSQSSDFRRVKSVETNLEGSKSLIHSKLGIEVKDTTYSNSSNHTEDSSDDGDDDDDDDIIIVEDMDLANVKKSETLDFTSARRQRRKSPVIPRQWIDDGDSKLDDVISISSSDSDDDDDDDDLKIVSSSISQNQTCSDAAYAHRNRRVQPQLYASALLFKCHICSEEITCHENANLFIKQHFGNCHNVYNIELVEHIDANGQKAFSIIDASSSLKQMNTGRRNSGKRLRSPLASRDVCNENNVPSDEMKKSKVNGETTFKNCSKNQRKGVKVNKTATLRTKLCNVNVRNRKARNKGRSHTSKVKHLTRNGKLSSVSVSAKNSYVDALPVRRTSRKNKAKYSI